MAVNALGRLGRIHLTALWHCRDASTRCSSAHSGGDAPRAAVGRVATAVAVADPADDGDRPVRAAVLRHFDDHTVSVVVNGYRKVVDLLIEPGQTHSGTDFEVRCPAVCGPAASGDRSDDRAALCGRPGEPSAVTESLGVGGPGTGPGGRCPRAGHRRRGGLPPGPRPPRRWAASGERARARSTDPADALTVQEVHISRLVADGATSKEAAARLYISPAPSTPTCATSSAGSPSLPAGSSATSRGNVPTRILPADDEGLSGPDPAGRRRLIRVGRWCPRPAARRRPASGRPQRWRTGRPRGPRGRPARWSP